MRQLQEQASGEALQQEKAKTMFPHPPTKESEVPKVIADWEKDCVEVLAMLGEKSLHTDESRNLFW